MTYSGERGVQRWEYIITLDNISKKELDEIGEDGWEMCGILQESHRPSKLYFKRPKQKEKRSAMLNVRAPQTEFLTDAKREQVIKEIAKKFDKNVETDETKNSDYWK